MDSEDLIIDGDKVSVYWESLPCLFDVEVLHTPRSIGDAWIVKERNGDVHHVLHYARITKEKRKQKYGRE